MAPRRVYNQSLNSGDSSFSNNGRVVTVGGGGGLNERFSQLQKPKNQQQPAPNNNQPARGSVFARIRVGVSAGAPVNNNNNNNKRRSDIQNRLSKPVKAGIRKRNGPTPMKGVERTGGQSARRGKPKTSGTAIPKGGVRGNTNNKGKRPVRGGKGKDPRAPLSTSDLDKALDDYMMKDPKVAQSKLDAELNEYMDDSGDVLMDL